MRIDPSVLGTIALVAVIAVVATAAAGFVSSPTTSVAIVLSAAVVAIALCARVLHRSIGLGAENLASSLPDELRAALDAPPVPVPVPGLVPMSAPVTESAARDARDTCPRCGTALRAEVGAFRQRDCDFGCGALVLDSERLLVERAGLDLEVVRALVREQGVKKSACPSCASVMHEGRLRGVVVDLCLSCGALWLDRQELATLTREHAFGGAA